MSLGKFLEPRKPKIITLMLTLNSEKWLKKGVLEALKEAAKGLNHRLLVVDSGSTDRTIDEIRKASGERAIIMHFPERNLASCRNFALENAPEDADFYCWVDSDIVVPKNFFSRLIPLFKDPSIGTAEIRAVLEADQPRSLVARYYRELRISQERGIKDTYGGATACLMMRPEVARNIRMDDRFIRAGEDIDFHFKVIRRGSRTVIDLNDPPARHARQASVLEELRRMRDRGMARALNLKLHGDLIRSQGLGRAVAASSITLLSWILFAYAIVSQFLIGVVPLLMLIARQALKLERPWRLDLSALGLSLSTVYVTAFLYGFIKYWMPGSLVKDYEIEKKRMLLH